VLAAFRKGEVRTLIATDIAARGIDVDGISHVVNYDLPNVPETYVHRIGRTARAGANGIAISLCDGEEVAFLRDIEKLIRMSLPVSGGRLPPAHGKEHGKPHAANERQRPSPTAATQQRHRQGGKPRRQRRHDEPRGHGEPRSHGEPRPHGGDISSVGFMTRSARAPRNAGSNGSRWTGQSQGS
jgi:ATP-dependent RNA helicase RhlE